MSRDLSLYMDNILESISKIELYVADTENLEAFVEDSKNL